MRYPETKFNTLRRLKSRKDKKGFIFHSTKALNGDYVGQKVLNTFQNFHESTMSTSSFFLITLASAKKKEVRRKNVWNFKSAHFKSGYRGKKMWCILESVLDNIWVCTKIFVVQNNESCWTFFFVFVNWHLRLSVRGWICFADSKSLFLIENFFLLKMTRKFPFK